MAIFLKVRDVLLNLERVDGIDLDFQSADRMTDAPLAVAETAGRIERFRDPAVIANLRRFFAGERGFPEHQTQSYDTIIDLTPVPGGES